MMQLQSPSFRDGAWIPRQHTAAGETLSPPLAWTELPRGARSLTLLLENLDLPSPARHGMPFLHWAVYDLQPSLPGLELGANRSGLPAGARAAFNDHGDRAYHLDVPALGLQRYLFRLLALDVFLDPHTLGRAGHGELFAAASNHVLESAELNAWYYQEPRGRS
jgi:Raf kinase inhibitor-like YbhB/YbcL family protein